MPHKFNEARRHKIPKAKYKVMNWPEYDAALVRRGSLTVWLTDDPKTGSWFLISLARSGVFNPWLWLRRPEFALAVQADGRGDTLRGPD